MTKRSMLAVALASVALAGAFYAGVAYGADSRLDSADAAIAKAIALLEAAENPGVKPPFGGHRDNAVVHLKKSREEIKKARAWADDPKHQPKPPKSQKPPKPSE